jgi:hypothetical protein
LALWREEFGKIGILEDGAERTINAGAQCPLRESGFGDAGSLLRDDVVGLRLE